MMAYRIMLGIALLTLGVLLFFFLWGVSDGTVSDFNILIWLVTLAVPAAAVAGGVAMRRQGHGAAAIALLGVVAVPAVLLALFFLLLILMQPRWN
ncbi:osmoprotectant transporter permease [Roseomonas sp. AR75]|uniref:osmoprotectant transporter permease n=1 Tax=Roseomonas sp. AR75 TaxID=2562311 RepID=UPI0010C100FB|nr:osmoprotectant transporter permease [Roseomonas sp. AR75]